MNLDKDIKKYLTRDAIDRRCHSWHLLNDEEMEIMWNQTQAYRDGPVPESSYFLSKRYQVESDATVLGKSWNETKQNAIHALKSNFPYICQVLNTFKDTIVVAGGSVFRALHNKLDRSCDIDIFFVNVTPEKANEVRLSLLTILIGIWMKSCSSMPEILVRKVYVTRNEFATSLYLIAELTNFEHLKYHVYKYQLIHRIYPNIASILGGFDLGPSMMAFDGTNFLAT
ncbi:MAG: hypothetical protein ACMG6E_08115, partial [Candidatus Roizmanbacteria bacterium]